MIADIDLSTHVYARAALGRLAHVVRRDDGVALCGFWLPEAIIMQSHRPWRMCQKCEHALDVRARVEKEVAVDA
jgi:hypothetical protein